MARRREPEIRIEYREPAALLDQIEQFGRYDVDPGERAFDACANGLARRCSATSLRGW
jgi:hypothetical protein